MDSEIIIARFAGLTLDEIIQLIHTENAEKLSIDVQNEAIHYSADKVFSSSEILSQMDKFSMPSISDQDYSTSSQLLPMENKQSIPSDMVKNPTQNLLLHEDKTQSYFIQKQSEHTTIVSTKKQAIDYQKHDDIDPKILYQYKNQALKNMTQDTDNKGYDWVTWAYIVGAIWTIVLLSIVFIRDFLI